MTSGKPPSRYLKDRVLSDHRHWSAWLATHVGGCMSRPLPLRLCCMAAMAPALTEAATTPRVKLLSSPPDAQKELNGGDHQTLTVGDRIISRSPVEKIKNFAKTTLVSISKKDLLANSKFTLHTVEEAKLLAGKQTIETFKLVHPRTFKSLEDLYQQKDPIILRPKQNGDLLISNSMSHSLLNGTSTTNSKAKDITSMMTMNGKTVAPNKPSILLQQKGPTLSVTEANSITETDCGDVPGNGSGDTAREVAEETDSNEGQSNIGAGDAPAIDVPQSPRPRSPQEEKMKDSVQEVTRRQKIQERRAERLLRRVRRLQTRQSHAHIGDQLTGLVRHQHKTLESMATSIKVPTTNADLKTELLQSEMKNLSTASLVNLVRRLQSSQSITTLKQRLTNSQSEAASVLRLDEDFCTEIEKTSSQLVSNVSHLEKGLDSDATESSSGGESCDEMDLEAESHHCRQVPLRRRAEWRWAQERAEVATRWTWLQAQVSDLEYRIRTHSDIHKQLRNSKGSVVLGEPPSPENLLKLNLSRTGSKKLSPIEAKIAKIEKKNEMSPANLSVLLCNVDRQAAKLTQSLGNCLTPIQSPGTPGNKSTRTSNGYIDTTPSIVNSLDTQDGASTSRDMCENSVLDNSCTAARCRPVRSYRKRKLYRTTGLHQMSRKASRLSTVRCQCYPPSTPCAMCGGRYNNTVPLDSDSLSLSEKVALLDNSFHSVLSFPQDIPLQIHFEALLKSGEWQNKPLPKQLKSTGLPSEKRKNKISAVDHVRKQSKKLAKTAVTLLSQKYRTKFSDRTRSRAAKKNSIKEKRRNRSEMKRRKMAKKLALAMKKKEKRRFSLPGSFYNKTPLSTAAPSPRDTPPPLTPGSLSYPTSSTTLKEMKELMKKRRGENAYDINNIVIPYSIASSTRVTKLQYKEIITPKWRELTTEDCGSESHVNLVTPLSAIEAKEGLPSNANGTIVIRKVDEEAEEMEDLTDEMFCARHLRCEVKEKKRYIAYIKKNKRNRGSRTESGAATPDPAGQPEPYPMDSILSSSFTSGFGTPPSTPVTVRAEEGRRRSGSVSYGSKRERDRTFSGDDRMSTCTPDFEEMWVPPWEPRDFPIPEDEYERMQVEMEDDINRAPPPPIVTHEMEQASIMPPSASEPVTPVHSSPPSPLPSTSSGSTEPSVVDEDPNDPEWTVLPPEARPRNIVLKLAKR